MLELPVHSVTFTRHQRAGGFAAGRAVLNLSQEIRIDIGRMVTRILSHVADSGQERLTISPIRTTDESDLHVMLDERWIEQKGRCFLCNGLLFPDTKNYLLQSSSDRFDSGETGYNRENTRITHLGCNLAKNKVSLEDFENWLAVVRKEVSDENAEASVVASVP